jgi:hypothetical protein
MDIRPKDNSGVPPAQPAQQAPKEGFIKKAAREVADKVSLGVGYVLDEFVPRRRFTSVEIKHDSPDYKNVSVEEGAKMIGYFTQKMENEGFPWSLYQPKKKGLHKMTPLGEFEALNRLSKGEPVIFQPNRVIGLGFNPPQFKMKDAAGNEAAGKVNIKSGGMEVRFGEPVEIKDFGDLKFFYELYNPEIKPDPKTSDPMKAAARDLAFFTEGTMATQYPWKMFKPQSWGKRAVAGAKQAVKSGAKWAAIGAGVAYVAKLSSLAIGLSFGGVAGVAAGMALGAGFGLIKGALSKRHGQEINVFETLSRLSENQPVFFQEQKKKEIGISIPFPLSVELGSLSYFTDHGTGSTVGSLEELKMFNRIQESELEKKNEAQKPGAKK